MIHPNGAESKSTITRIAGTATGGKRQGREVPQLLRVQPGAKHLVWKTQFKLYPPLEDCPPRINELK